MSTERFDQLCDYAKAHGEESERILAEVGLTGEDFHGVDELGGDAGTAAAFFIVGYHAGDSNTTSSRSETP